MTVYGNRSRITMNTRYTRAPGPRTPIRLHKRVAFGVVTAIAVYAVIELMSFAAYGFATGTVFSWHAVRNEQQSRLSFNDGFDLHQWDAHRIAGDTTWIALETLHPYVGYVYLPEKNTPGQISEYGYRDRQPPFHRRSDDKVIIGVVGGSVAEQFALNGARRLMEVLQESPQFASKQLVVVNVAIRGYKQPQQLLTITWLLTLGAEFDMIINIDGFNEVALHEKENGSRKVFPAFPRSWYVRPDAGSDPVRRRLIGHDFFLQFQRRDLARTWAAAPWRHSVFCTLLWKWQDNRLRRKSDQTMQMLQKHTDVRPPYVCTGPLRTFDDPAELYAHLVEIWKNSSIQLDHLCRANGITYFHFLQPNQYTGFKPMSDEERRVAIAAAHPYRRGAERGYPLLIRAGSELAQHGLRFTELTGLFSNVSEPVYTDDCCHVNQLGDDLMAERIAAVILADGSAGQVSGAE